MVTERPQGPSGVDVNTPNVARMYDYYLGGKDNFAADREAAERILAAFPDTPAAARTNRRFLQRAVRHLAADEGVRQFLDIGAGLPTQGNVHEVAHSVTRDARVLYVDYDPVVVRHAQALLTATDTVAVAQADLREPEAVLRHAAASGFIDFAQPVALLLVSVLHFIPDDADPLGIVARLRDALAPGSHVVISHLTTDGAPVEQVRQSRDVYKQATAPIVPRSHDGVLRFFDGLDVVDPGLVWVADWRSDAPEGAVAMGRSHCYAGVGRKGPRADRTA